MLRSLYELISSKRVRNLSVEGYQPDTYEGVYLVLEPIVVYKKAYFWEALWLQPLIIEMVLPQGAKFVVANLDQNPCLKLRANCALPVAFTSQVDVARSSYDTELEYRIGQMAIPDGFNQSLGDECQSGIHFFLEYESAVAYV